MIERLLEFLARLIASVCGLDLGCAPVELSLGILLIENLYVATAAVPFNGLVAAAARLELGCENSHLIIYFICDNL